MKLKDRDHRFFAPNNLAGELLGIFQRISMFASVPLSGETAVGCIFYLCTSPRQSSACVQECESCLLISPSYEIILLRNQHGTAQ